MLTKPKTIHRTTFDQVFDGTIPFTGVYVLAYMGKVIYIGKAEESVMYRFVYHIEGHKSLIGDWLKAMEFDWPNIRLDILEPPDYEDRAWLMKVEEACIHKFNPLFNESLMVQAPVFWPIQKQEIETP